MGVRVGSFEDNNHKISSMGLIKKDNLIDLLDQIYSLSMELHARIVEQECHSLQRKNQLILLTKPFKQLRSHF